MKILRKTCKKCEKPLEWMLPTGDGEAESPLGFIEAQMFMSHSIICGGCKTENKLAVDKVTLKVQ